MAGLIILIVLYLVAIFAGFIAPYDYEDEVRDLQWSPPTAIHFSDAAGFSWRPFVYPTTMDFDENFRLVRKTDTTRRCYLRFFVHGATYKLLGIFNTNVRLIGVDPIVATDSANPYYSRIYLLGSDLSGRDVFSRICYGGAGEHEHRADGRGFRPRHRPDHRRRQRLLRRPHRRSAPAALRNDHAAAQLLHATDAALRLSIQHGFAAGLLCRHPDSVAARLGQFRAGDPRHGAVDPQGRLHPIRPRRSA